MEIASFDNGDGMRMCSSCLIALLFRFTASHPSSCSIYLASSKSQASSTGSPLTRTPGIIAGSKFSTSRHFLLVVLQPNTGEYASLLHHQIDLDATSKTNYERELALLGSLRFFSSHTPTHAYHASELVGSQPMCRPPFPSWPSKSQSISDSRNGAT